MKRTYNSSYLIGQDRLKMRYNKKEGTYQLVTVTYLVNKESIQAQGKKFIERSVKDAIVSINALYARLDKAGNVIRSKNGMPTFPVPSKADMEHYNRAMRQLAEFNRMKQTGELMDSLFKKNTAQSAKLRYSKIMDRVEEKIKGEKGNNSGYWGMVRNLRDFSLDSKLKLSHSNLGSLIFAQKFKAYLLRRIDREEIKQNTGRNYLKYFKIIIEELAEEKLIDNPFPTRRSFKAIPAADVKREGLSYASRMLLWKTPLNTSFDIRAAFFTSIHTGLRWSDIKALKVGQLDFEEMILSYSAKKSRTKDNERIPISSFLSDLVKPFTKGKVKTELVFHLPSGGNVNSHLKRWAALACIEEDIFFHKARHTFGRIITSQNGLHVTKQLMGHKDISNTMIYSTPEELEMRNAIEAIRSDYDNDKLKDGIVEMKAKKRAPLKDAR